MPRAAKNYISVVVVAGLVLLFQSVWALRIDDKARFALFLLLAVMSSTMKVRLPRITGTYSLNFLILLVAIVTCKVSETALLAGVSGLVQCGWRPLKRPSLLQIIFNISALALTAATCHVVYERLLRVALVGHEIVAMAFVALLYWVVNTGLISIVLTLLDEGTFRQILNYWHLWSLPYYLVGAAFGGMVSFTIRRGEWPAALAMLPVMGIISVIYRIWIDRKTMLLQQAISTNA